MSKAKMKQVDKVELIKPSLSKCCNAPIAFNTSHGDIAYCSRCKETV